MLIALGVEYAGSDSVGWKRGGIGYCIPTRSGGDSKRSGKKGCAMLIKLGVSIERLSRRARRGLEVVAAIFTEFGHEAIISSTYEGNHSPRSLHYANDAFDVRLPPDGVLRIAAALRERLGAAFDVVVESDHIHIEYDPKVS